MKTIIGIAGRVCIILIVGFIAAYPAILNGGGSIHHTVAVLNATDNSILVVVERGALPSPVSGDLGPHGEIVLDCGSLCPTKLCGVIASTGETVEPVCVNFGNSPGPAGVCGAACWSSKWMVVTLQSGSYHYGFRPRS